MSSRILRRTLLTAVWMVAGLTATAGAGGRLVAVGDVHGSYDGLVEILGRAGLINSEANWIGGDATLVQTGDLFDRGLEVRAVLDLLMRLQEEAAAAGGEVIVLLGNHEAMNLHDYFRDVNPEMYATFADTDSEKRRKAGYKAFKAYWVGRARAAGVPPPKFTDEIKAQWMAAHPAGWIEYLEALGPEGHYGKWLRERPIAALIDGTLFIHGGLGPALAGMTVEEINRRAAEELRNFDAARAYMVEQGMVPPTAGLVG
ncbi:MAG: metallophosphoesterase, partial [Acidobacteriota bacterium]